MTNIRVKPGSLPDIPRKIINTMFDAVFNPPTTVVPTANGQLSIEATSNTELTLKYKGDDGVVRSRVLILS